jgi:putative heme-binding domain-containing protein
MIGEVWGIVRTSPAEKRALIERYTKLIGARGPEPDLVLGRLVFSQTCQQCHKLFDSGGDVGPELTGSNRANLDYLLSNVLDPSAVMAKDYQPAIVVTDDGRTVTGIVKAENEAAVTLRTANETLIIPKNEIEILKKSEQSMMPDNIWQKLSNHEVRSLVAYMASRQQIPLLATKENAQTFFNGKDLTGWTGNSELWTVKDGVIIGETKTGSKKNEFLFNDLLVEDFDLTLKIRVTPNSENSGIQFRSERLSDGHAKGYQADAGKGWWGKLYHEHGRALLWNKPGDQHVKPEEWNEYRIRSVGHKIQTWINGNLCVDLDDPEGETRGLIAFQIHSGGPMKIEVKDLVLKVVGE